MKQLALSLLLVIVAPSSVACRSSRPNEMFGKTYYLDGAGNLGFGPSEVRRGLVEAGYRGDVEPFVWTTSLNPLLDQWNRERARKRAGALASNIDEYHRQYPGEQINVVALSAGTGVALWALERLPEDVEVENVFLLGSSLAYNYDVSKAMRHVRGRVFVYHSPHDLVLASVRYIGTIDGKHGIDSAGQVGLNAPPRLRNRVVNVAWSREWERLNWHGGHGNCANAAFARAEIARHILTHSDKMTRLVLCSDDFEIDRTN